MPQLDVLLQTRVDWKTSDDDPYVFQALYRGNVARVRFNDFPDEPICTVIVDGVETDLEEFPDCWTLPRHRNEA